MKILSSFTHPHTVPNLHDFLSSLEDKKKNRYILNNIHIPFRLLLIPVVQKTPRHFLTLFPPLTSFSLNLCFHCYMKIEVAYAQVKLTWSPIIQQHVNQNCLMLQRKMLNPQSIWMCKLWACWWTRFTKSMFWSTKSLSKTRFSHWQYLFFLFHRRK